MRCGCCLLTRFHRFQLPTDCFTRWGARSRWWAYPTCSCFPWLSGNRAAGPSALTPRRSGVRPVTFTRQHHGDGRAQAARPSCSPAVAPWPRRGSVASPWLFVHTWMFHLLCSDFTRNERETRPVSNGSSTRRGLFSYFSLVLLTPFTPSQRIASDTLREPSGQPGFGSG